MKSEIESFSVGDIVTLITKRQAIGTITRVSWMPDSDDEHWQSFSEYEDEYAEEPLEPEHVEVLWMDNLKLSMVHYKKIKAIDRGFVHGDIVASASDPNGQTCTVVDVVLTVDLQLVKTGQKFQNVLPKYLTDIHPFMIGRHVVRKTPPLLVGTIDDVICDIEVKFNDGSVCLLEKATPERVKIVEDDVSDDEVEPERNYLYYPSQQVSANQAIWDQGTYSIKNKAKENQNQTRKKKDKHRIHAHITKVNPSQLEVFWHNQKRGDKKISETCSTDEITLLSHFKHTKFEVGDLTMIHPDVRNYFLSLSQQKSPETSSLPTGKGKKPKNPKKGAKVTQKKEEEKKESQPVIEESNTTNISQDLSVILQENEKHESLIKKIDGWIGTDVDTAKILSTQTFIKVRWQDGTGSTEWKHSTDFVPKKYLLDCDFWPGKFVCRISVNQNRLGLIVMVNAIDRTAIVKWLDNEEQEEVSVYDIAEQTGKKFRLGGIVVSLKSENVGEVLEISGNEISVAWANQSISRERYTDLDAIDTDDEDEGPDDDLPSEKNAGEGVAEIQVVEKKLDEEDVDQKDEKDEKDEKEEKVEKVEEKKDTTVVFLKSCTTPHQYLDNRGPQKIGRLAPKE
jgi:ubiquitin-conjugating enzyme E2 O